MNTEKLYIDGRLEEGADPRGYRQWRAVTSDGRVHSYFYGEQSLLAYNLFIQMWNKKNINAHTLNEIIRVAKKYAICEGSV